MAEKWNPESKTDDAVPSGVDDVRGVGGDEDMDEFEESDDLDDEEDEEESTTF